MMTLFSFGTSFHFQPRLTSPLIVLLGLTHTSSKRYVHHLCIIQWLDRNRGTSVGAVIISDQSSVASMCSVCVSLCGKRPREDS